MPPPKIAIIGAGPAGLTLARLLQKQGVACEIYDADASPSARNQGGTLDLHPRAGQQALKEAGLFEEFQKYARPEAEAMKLVRNDGTVLWDENVMGNVRPEELTDRPEIDRVALRNILLESLESGTVKWGKKLLVAAEDKSKKAKYDLHFADDTTVEGVDLLIGADGAWSRVRPLLTDEKPHYSGVSTIELWSMNADEKAPWLAQYVGAGSCFMLDEGRALQCQRNGDGSVRVYASVRQPEDWVERCGIDWSTGDAARETLLKRHFDDCADDLKRVVRECKDNLIPRTLWMLPVGHEWKHRPGVTLLGDAAHLMTPFAGVGVNVAMADALELARALVRRKESFTAKAFSDNHNIDVAIKEYEPSMFERSKRDAQKTAKNLKLHFSAEGGNEMVGRLNQHLAAAQKK